MICKVSIGGYVLGMYFEIQSGFELAVYTVYPLLPCQKKNMHSFIIPGSHRYHGIYMKYQKMNRHMTSICQRNCSKLFKITNFRDLQNSSTELKSPVGC